MPFLALLQPLFSWAAPFMASMLVGILKNIIEELFSEDVTKRVLVDVAWWVANKENSQLGKELVNTMAKGLGGYGYHPELDQGVSDK